MNRDFISNSNCILRNIFNDEENIDIIKDFVEKILETKIKKIIFVPDIEYLLKGKMYGIKEFQAIDENNKKINIGIKIIDGQYIQEKILIYGALIHANLNNKYINVTSAPTITINIVDMEYFSTQEYHKKIIFEEEKIIFLHE